MIQYDYRILGIDLGAKRIGLAIADPALKIATGLSVIPHKGLKPLLASLRKIISEENIRLIVIGLPLNMDGTEGEKARQARTVADKICESLGIEVKLMDERLTTDVAVKQLHAAKSNVGKNRTKIDMMAAMVILQDYLDELPSGKPE
jgi:putative Holliday junction resolvase